jgi:hypothetical protein
LDYFYRGGKAGKGVNWSDALFQFGFASQGIPSPTS